MTILPAELFTAFAAALLPTIAVVVSAIFGFSNISRKADAIHSLCNSQLHTVKQDVMTANSVSEKLQSEIVSIRHELTAASKNEKESR
jgi:hypothetical protein